MWFCWCGELDDEAAIMSVNLEGGIVADSVIQIPAMTYLLSPDEQGPLHLSIGQLIVWSVGLCYFGVVFAVPLYVQSSQMASHVLFHKLLTCTSQAEASDHQGAPQVPQRFQYSCAHLSITWQRTPINQAGA